MEGEHRTEAQLLEEIARLKRQNAELEGALTRAKRRDADDALRESEERYRELANTLVAGVVVHAADTSILLSNKSASRILGLTEDQLRGKTAIDPAWSFLREDGSVMPLDEYPVNRVIAERKQLEQYVVGIDKPGEIEPTWVLVNAAPLFDHTNGGALQEVVVTFVDITDRNQAERERELQRRALDGSKRIFEAALECETEEELGKICLAVAEEATGSEFGFMAESEDGELFETIAISNPGWDVCEIPKDVAVRSLEKMPVRGIRAIPVREGRSIIVNDPSSHADFIAPPEGHPPLACFIGIPMKRGARTVGLLGLGNKPGGYDEDDLRAAEALAGASGQALERKRAEEALKRSEERFRGVFESPMIGTLFWDANGDISDANDTFLEMVGYTRDEVLTGKVRWRDMTPPEYEEQDNRALDEIVATGVMTPVEKEYLRKDGTRVPIILGAAALSGATLSGVAFVLDITDRKRAEEQLHIKNIVFESSLAAKSVAHNDAVIHTVNPAFVELWGYDSKEDAVGNTVADFFVNPEDAAPIIEALNETGRWEGEFLAKKKDGTRFISRGLGTVVKNDKGEQIGYQSTNLDVTPQREAEEKLRSTLVDLRRSNEELQQFAYVASHDLQEPLRMVGSYVQLLEKRYGDKLDDDARDFIGYAVDGANRMKALITDLLEFSRVETRGQPFETVMAGDAAREARDNLEIAIEESGAEVKIAKLPEVRADRSQLVQLFQNLIGNAIKFARKGEKPRVEIESERGHDNWEIAVSDNGIGIDEQYRDRIFVIFQRLHKRQEFKGTGIGLSICRKIVERHGGRIWFESEPGAGTTFRFTLPA